MSDELPEAKNSELLPEGSINVVEEKKDETDEKGETPETQETSGNEERKYEKSEKKKNEELKERRKLKAIIFLSALTVLSIITFIFIFDFYTDYYTGIFECKYIGNGKTRIFNSFYNINKESELKIIVNKKTYKNENPIVNENGIFDVKIKIVGKEINMSRMFRKTNLKTINMNSIRNTKILDMENAFDGCKFLENFTIRGFNTTKARNLDNIFSGCHNLKELDLTNMNGSKVRYMSNAFAHINISKINLTSFNLRKLESIKGIFKNSSCTILVNEKDYTSRTLKSNLIDYQNVTMELG